MHRSSVARQRDEENESIDCFCCIELIQIELMLRINMGYMFGIGQLMDEIYS